MDIEEYKNKIRDYSQSDLEEILFSLNKDKFPEKHQIVREILAKKKSGTLDNEENEQTEENTDEQKVEEESKKTIEDEDQVESEEEQSFFEVILFWIAFLTAFIAVLILVLSHINTPIKSSLVNLLKTLPFISNS